MEQPFDAENVNRRNYFFVAFCAAKFYLQSHLQQKLGCWVLIGPTDRKVNYGVRNDDLARFYQVSELVEFLKRKKYDTMLFNLWYDRRSRMDKEDFIKKALPIVEKAIFEAVDRAVGITELKLDEI